MIGDSIRENGCGFYNEKKATIYRTKYTVPLNSHQIYLAYCVCEQKPNRGNHVKSVITGERLKLNTLKQEAGRKN